MSHNIWYGDNYVMHIFCKLANGLRQATFVGYIGVNMHVFHSLCIHVHIIYYAVNCTYLASLLLSLNHKRLQFQTYISSTMS